MKEFEVGDEVLVKLTVTYVLQDGDVQVKVRDHAPNGTLSETIIWLDSDLVTDNLGKPQPLEPQKIGALVRAENVSGTVARFTRTEAEPLWPWSGVGKEGKSGPYTWDYILGTKNKVTVLFGGLD